MKEIAKWIAIIWSIFCLIGVFVGMANVGEQMEGLKNEYEKAGATVGMGCGFGLWVAAWLAIAGPAIIVYFVSGKKEPIQVEFLPPSKNSELCIECGKYFQGEPKYCPHCGKPTKHNK